MSQPVLVAGARTPIGRLLGSLSSQSASRHHWATRKPRLRIREGWREVTAEPATRPGRHSE